LNPDCNTSVESPCIERILGTLGSNSRRIWAGPLHCDPCARKIHVDLPKECGSHIEDPCVPKQGLVLEHMDLPCVCVCVPFIINQTPAAGGDHCHGPQRAAHSAGLCHHVKSCRPIDFTTFLQHRSPRKHVVNFNFGPSF